MCPVQYCVGDATVPPTDGPFVITHVVNDGGRWGRGFVGALTARWPRVEAAYRAWARGQGQPGDPTFTLGAVQFVQVAPEGWVANCVAQHGIRSPQDRISPAPIRYDALAIGLAEVAAFAHARGATVHAPRLGAGLAGGSWPTIAQILQTTVIAADVAVTIYDWPPPRAARAPGR